jgi:hypothetical protein
MLTEVNFIHIIRISENYFFKSLKRFFISLNNTISKYYMFE